MRLLQSDLCSGLLYVHGTELTWQNIWQGGRAISGSAAGFHALSTRRLSLGLRLIVSMSCTSWSTPFPL